ncbi:MAG TPA: hypothetical protein VHO25_16335, partial [Polyangiaceae bacterium]|nr:hypothetical protein [Polyangiaceae bacterium]
MPKSSRDPSKGRSKKSSDSSDGTSSRPSSLPPPTPSQRERPSSRPAAALPLSSVEAGTVKLGEEFGRGRQDSGVESTSEAPDAVASDERPSVPATPSARRVGSDPFLAAPTFLGSPLPPSDLAPSNLSARTEDSASIRLDDVALLDPEGDDDDYAKTPIASIKNLAKAPTAPSLRPN